MSRAQIIRAFSAVLIVIATGTFAACGTSTRSGTAERSTKVLTLELRFRSERPLSASEMSRAITVMNARLQRLGVRNFGLRAAGASGISLRLLPNQKQLSRLASVFGSVGRLELFDLEPSLVRGVSSASDTPKPRTLYQLLDSARAMAERDGASSFYLFNGKHELVAGPALKPGLLPGPGATRAPSDEVLGVPNGTELVSCGLATSRFCPGGAHGGFLPRANQTWYYLFRLPPQLTNEDLKASGIRAEYNSSNGPQVDLSFSPNGNKIFHEITREEWSRGQTSGAQHFAVVLDGRLITFPQIDPMDKSLSAGIDPSISGAIIEGIGSISEANDIAAVLRTGALPASLDVVATKRVSVTSGG